MFAPAINIITTTIATILTAVLKSGCSIIRPNTIPATIRKGSTPFKKVLTSSFFLLRALAVYIIMASFANSEGWMVCPPMEIHRVAPFSVTPRPGTKTSINETNPAINIYFDILSYFS